MLNVGSHVLVSCFVQSPPLSNRCEDMQALLSQLLLQLSIPMTTKDEMMQRLLVTGCCKCLQSVCLQSAAANRIVSLCCDTAPIAAVVMRKTGLSAGTQLVVILTAPMRGTACRLCSICWEFDMHDKATPRLAYPGHA